MLSPHNTTHFARTSTSPTRGNIPTNDHPPTRNEQSLPLDVSDLFLAICVTLCFIDREEKLVFSFTVFSQFQYIDIPNLKP